MGYRSGNSDWFFYGSLDDIAIYNRVLSVAEVNSLYQESDPDNLMSMDQHENTENIEMFPNPTSGNLTIKTLLEMVDLDIYTLSGSCVFSTSFISGNNNIALKTRKKEYT